MVAQRRRGGGGAAAAMVAAGGVIYATAMESHISDVVAWTDDKRGPAQQLISLSNQ